MLWPALCAGLAVVTIPDAEANTLSIQTPSIDTKIALAGSVLGREGQPIGGATVQVLAFGARAKNAGGTATTDGSGAFQLEEIDRRSVPHEVTRAGTYTETYPADLHRPSSAGSISVGNLTLADPDGEQETGSTRSSSRAADAEKVVRRVADADDSVVDCKCTVSADPGPERSYESDTSDSHPEDSNLRFPEVASGGARLAVTGTHTIYVAK
ncbi:hypothetical protein [Nannocystis punicea]|uniref:Carboxypeptidase regulatory-like domain-containing protein n=1 Tax=Nannocystis punicea TaxID=2995304 RepID=A0ABY7HBL0_9BACT|nr:hypothetical protein [Nannocystis poenicansa]WAS96475.1 hypothetical protein O0S08_09975 [Nannocystis poenicansa]